MTPISKTPVLNDQSTYIADFANRSTAIEERAVAGRSNSWSATATTDEFKKGMRRLAGGVCLITTFAHDQPSGLVATSVNSLSMEPPSLLVCVGRGSNSHDSFVNSGFFCVNLLNSADEDLARLFGDPSMRAQRFAKGNWERLMTGAPALNGALANFDCKLVRQFEYGSHSIFVGEVCQIRLASEDISPLIYLNGAYTSCASGALT